MTHSDFKGDHMDDANEPGLPGADGWGRSGFQELFGAEGGVQPLAARMRPRSLEEFFGQAAIVGPGQLLRRAIEADRISSLILWGPPGTGKTSLAAVIARRTKSHFETINAVMAGVADIRKVVSGAQRRRQASGQRTILLVDEIHRFNRAQQDALLPHVEDGTLILIGATTENPFFEVNKALISRSTVFQLHPLGKDEILRILKAAMAD
jgi:putative ATPase